MPDNLLPRDPRIVADTKALEDSPCDDAGGRLVAAEHGGPRRVRVCLISLSVITSDGRVLRQIEYLRPHYQLTVLGFGNPDPTWTDVTWISLPSSPPASAKPLFPLVRKPLTLIRLLLARIRPSLYGRVLATWPVAAAYEQAIGVRADLYWANDWGTLPAAAEAARRHAGKVLFDAHEYGPLEWEESAMFRFRDAPSIDYVLRRYAPQCDASLTVCTPIAERYAREYGLDPVVVRNAPKLQTLPPPRPRDGHIRLVHHGGAIPWRRPERMIEMMRFTDERFTLTFMLVGDAGYIRGLQQLANHVAPGRVFFVEPVAPASIVERIAEFDLGIFLLDTRCYNYMMALPNKFFEFIVAGLGVCIGPSPAMVELVRQYDCGVVAPSTKPRVVAALLNTLTDHDVDRLRSGALVARREVNADTEMAKALAVVDRLLSAKTMSGVGDCV